MHEMATRQGMWKRGAGIRDQATAVNQLRVARGFTQRELAARAGVSSSTIETLMRGGSCSVRVHVAVARVLGADVLDLWPDLATHPDVLHVEAPRAPQEGNTHG